MVEKPDSFITNEDFGVALEVHPNAVANSESPPMK